MRADRPLHAWTSHRHTIALPEGHPFPAAKYAPLVERLLAERVLEVAQLHHSRPAPVDWLELVHDPGYIERALTGGLDGEEVRRLGLPWSPELALRARAGVYGTVMASRAALVHGVAGNLAGGSHHAYRDRGEAYCLFNDLAIAIALLREDGAARRPLIADLDVHQGNGTAALFADDPSVFTFSFHGAGNYPVCKERGSFDRSFPDDCDDVTYLAALDRDLPSALDAHDPDLVIYQAGVDGLATDRLGRLALTPAGLAARDERVLGWCEARGVSVVVTLGGGYARPLEASIEAHAEVWRALRRARDRRRVVHDDVMPVDDVDGAESRL